MLKQASRLIVLYTLLLFYACSENAKQITTTFDQYLISAKDSIFDNPTAAHNLIIRALQSAPDSLSFYQAYDYLAIYYTQINMMDSALIYLNRVSKFVNDNNNEEVRVLKLTNFNNRAVYLSFLGKIDSALFYNKLALDLAEEIRDFPKTVDVSINYADNKLRNGEYVAGINYYRKALHLIDSLRLDSSYYFPVYFGLGQAYYLGLRNFVESESYFAKAEVFEINRNLSERYTFYNNRANSYFFKGDYYGALRYFQKALQLVEPVNAEYYMHLCYANLSDVYCRLDSLNKAIEYSEKSYTFFEQMGNTFVRDYISLVKANIALKQKLPLKARQILFSSVDSAYALDAEILGLRYNALVNFYNATKDYEKAFQYQLKSNRLTDSLRSERMSNMFAETEMRYKQDTAFLRREYLIAAKDDEIKGLNIKIIRWAGFSIITILAVIFFFIMRRRKLELERVKLMEVVAKLRMKNIRNRISPHFIFNVLNSEIANKPENSELFYLAKMLRQSLELTEQLAVSLLQELNFVSNYIAIKKFRLGDDFVYKLSVEPGLSPEAIKVPGMIIQIPVENAIKHGLHSITGSKKLDISIQNDNAGVKIEIMNNGHAYKPELNTATKGTGIGLSVIFRTIALLNEKNTHKITFDIQALNENEQTGTRVQIIIPNDFNYDI
ncbi:MAG: tetratricopeptide repeat protein [Paludibacter sp.]|nr:tetratricopeptide repeat protein [Paludibacter sp.]